MKVLDYLAAGLPTLGTSESVTGLAPDHPGVMVEDEIRAWPSVLGTLLRDHMALREIGTDGRLSIERELSWQHIGTNLLRHTHTWLASSGSRPRSTVAGGRTPLNVPRWFAEHTSHNALGTPETTKPGQPHWLRNARTNQPIAPHGRA